MKFPPIFAQFPAHKNIAAKIVDLLQRDEKVLGLYLSGSFAHGKPDMYSDLDIYIFVPAESREQMIKDHEQLRGKVGDIVSEFPATHLGDPNQIITFYRGNYPIHVDYEYTVKDELTLRKKDEDVLILMDKTGDLQKWKTACANANEPYSPTQEQLQYFEDRFWAWCIYTDSKIKRGEVWEARDSLEYMRKNVIVRLVYFMHSLRSEGNRRIETKFPKDTVQLLESTLPKGHSQKEYSETLRALANCYLECMEEVTKKFNIAIHEKDRDFFRGFLMQS